MNPPRCSGCGRPLVFMGGGRYACTNPDCQVKYGTINSRGKLQRTVTEEEK